MKNLALTILISAASVALSAEEFTIQTISAQKEGSITPAFEQKVHKSALVSSKKKEGSCNIVTVGRYQSTKQARHDLVKARAIAKDAFVRPVTRSLPKACAQGGLAGEKTHKTGPSSAVAMSADVNQSRTDAKAHKAAETAGKGAASADKSKETVVAQKPTGAVATVEKPKEASAAVAAAPVSKPAPAAKAEASASKLHSDGAIHTTVLLYDRNLARKSDIHEAIEYYKTSPYHTFTPVAMQK